MQQMNCGSRPLHFSNRTKSGETLIFKETQDTKILCSKEKMYSLQMLSDRFAGNFIKNLELSSSFPSSHQFMIYLFIIHIIYHHELKFDNKCVSSHVIFRCTPFTNVWWHLRWQEGQRFMTCVTSEYYWHWTLQYNE